MQPTMSSKSFQLRSPKFRRSEKKSHQQAEKPTKRSCGSWLFRFTERATTKTVDVSPCSTCATPHHEPRILKVNVRKWVLGRGNPDDQVITVWIIGTTCRHGIWFGDHERTKNQRRIVSHGSQSISFVNKAVYMYVLPVVGLTAPPGPLAPIMRQNTIFGNRPRHGHHPKGNRGNQQPTIDVSQVAHHRRYLPQVLNVLLMRLFRPDNYIIHGLFQRQTGCFGFLVLTYGYFGNFFRLCHSRNPPCHGAFFRPG